jgi:hypothetical protein
MSTRAGALVLVLLLSLVGCGPITPSTELDAGVAADAGVVADARVDVATDAGADAGGEPGSDAGATCGNGIVDPGESCDVAVASGDDACPRTSGCTAPTCGRPRLEGTRCTARCVVDPIVERIAGDGCCPDGASHAEDPDCARTCTDECSPASSPSCLGDELRGCADVDGDGCVEYELVTTCPGACSAGACVACVAHDDCPVPTREACQANACVARVVWAEATLSIDGGAPMDLGRAVTADATYLPSFDTATLRFQQGGGHAVWIITTSSAATEGPNPLATAGLPDLSLSLTSAFGAAAGGYSTTSGTIRFARHELGTDGVIEGTLDATLVRTGGGHTARLVATFHGTLE